MSKRKKQTLSLQSRERVLKKDLKRRKLKKDGATKLRRKENIKEKNFKRVFADLFKTLHTLGKPLYLIIVFIAIALLFIAYLIGHVICVYIPSLIKFLLRNLFELVRKLITKKISKLVLSVKLIDVKKELVKRIKISLPKTSPPLPNIDSVSLPTLRRPTINLNFLGKVKDLKKKINISFRITKFKIPKISFTLLSFKAGRKTKIIFVLVSLFFVVGFAFWYTILKDLPTPGDLVKRKVQVSTKILDRNGVLLYKIYKDENRTPVSLSQIPLQVRAATLAAEDAGFYSHAGISLKGIARSAWVDITKGQLTGGSTITQQLVKNALLSPEKTFTRKIKEVVLSIETELAYSKDQILEMYLNEVPYGGTAFGIEEASKLYFDKDVDKLTLGEAALLAGLPRSPTSYSPYGATPELASTRQREVLRLMNENGFITKDEMIKAQNEKITFAPNRIDIKAPHFVMYIKQQLAEKYGEEAVETGGLTVTTTLDWQIQKMAEEVVKKQIEGLTNYHVGNGAAVVLDPKTGEILAMVGSKDYFDTKNDGNVNVVISPRQPGSSIKPITYAYALSHGFTPSTIINDSPTKFAIPGQAPYVPKNYDGQFRGNITIRSALAESRNIPAVKILATFGVEKLIQLGQKMGITTWKDPSQYGLSLTLGGGETKLIDLAQAYATIANSGTRPAISSIARVTDYRGKVLEENTCRETQKPGEVYAAESVDNTSCNTEAVIDPRVSYLLIDILKDNNARAPEFGLHSSLVIPKHPEVAVKTGTSNDLKDNLTVGFNQNYLTAVWVGNNDGSSMSRIASGITGAAPIWNEIMSRLLANAPSIAWEKPKGVSTIAICAITGTLPCEGCPTRSEVFLDENKPQFACKSDQIVKADEKTKKSSSGQILDFAASTQNPN